MEFLTTLQLELAKLTTAIRDRFRAFDINGDGTLSKKELKDAFASMVGASYYLMRNPSPRLPRAPRCADLSIGQPLTLSAAQGKTLTDADIDELMIAFDVDNSLTIDVVDLRASAVFPMHPHESCRLFLKSMQELRSSTLDLIPSHHLEFARCSFIGKPAGRVRDARARLPQHPPLPALLRAPRHRPRLHGLKLPAAAIMHRGWRGAGPQAGAAAVREQAATRGLSEAAGPARSAGGRASPAAVPSQRGRTKQSDSRGGASPRTFYRKTGGHTQPAGAPSSPPHRFNKKCSVPSPVRPRPAGASRRNPPPPLGRVLRAPCPKAGGAG